MFQTPGPKIANASEGAHFLKNVISIADMTQKLSKSSALLIGKYNVPTRNNNNPGITVIKSKDDHGISATNNKAIKDEQPDHPSSHRENMEVLRVQRTIIDSLYNARDVKPGEPCETARRA